MTPHDAALVLYVAFCSPVLAYTAAACVSLWRERGTEL